MDTDAEVIDLPIVSGQYFINMYENGQVGNTFKNRIEARLAAGDYSHRRLRLKVTNFGDTLDIFDVDQTS